MLLQKPYHHPYIPPNSLPVQQAPYVGAELANLTSMTPFLRGQGEPIYPYPQQTTKGYGAMHYGVINLGLMQGSKGQSVTDLQNKLISLGYSVGSDGADGDFGSNTKSGLIAYQKASGLPQTGTVDAATLSALQGGATASSSTALTTGQQAEKPKWWQTAGQALTTGLDAFGKKQQEYQPTFTTGLQPMAMPEKQGMSTGVKIGIAVGGVVVVGLLVAVLAKD